MTDWVMEAIMDIAKAGGWLTGGSIRPERPKDERTLIHILRANRRNARAHTNKQRSQIAAGLRKFSFVNPVLVDDADMIFADRGRVESVKLEGFSAFPVVRLNHLTDAQERAEVIADDKISEQAGWDLEILAIELGELIDPLTVAGFESFEQIGAARLASDDAPRRRHSGPADGRSLATSALSSGQTVNASRGDEGARGVQMAVASERGNVR
jgi:hypothetical protein